MRNADPRPVVPVINSENGLEQLHFVPDHRGSKSSEAELMQ